MQSTSPCQTDLDCDYLFYCKSLSCFHKDFLMPEPQEVFGMVLMSFLGGFTSLAGIGGGAEMLPILVSFFGYSQKIGLLLVFIPILGATTGNVINLSQQKDNFTGNPLINFKLAIIVCPMMALGNLAGLMTNRILPSFMLISILVYLLFNNIKKTYKRFLMDYQKETFRQQEKQLIGSNLLDFELYRVDSYAKIQKSFDQQPSAKEIYKQVGILSVIICTLLLFYFIRGSRDNLSIFNFQYCGFFYWVTTFLFGIFCFLAYKTAVRILLDESQLKILENQRRIETGDMDLIIDAENVKEILMTESFKAGLMSGFGLGGGMFLVPMYVQAGLSSTQATGTSSFNIFIIAFLSVIQVVITGIITPLNTLEIVIFMTLGTYMSSRFIYLCLKRLDRLSIIMFFLLYFSTQAMIILPLQFFKGWYSRGFSISEVIKFQEFC